ncbi:hypothetical protein GGU10DRAFT_336372 [Lentinula aff. detonsa]|uniref:Glucose-methanol-choline oxidoreductase N-terminal domain-containing protein n=1 Tax=Lentinula aff. detonsa TaxID=2804958 RepID=A0AA38KCA5_9AGAR|nr:hypothetical protein GGU10DRAFT_336372 [Lentinula aff. detonsa]
MPFLDTYDIVFAGGGTTACIIAGRLAQADPSLKILIIEAGSHSFDLHHHVQPARYLNSLMRGHTVSHHRSVQSKALVMIYTRPAASDYDDWANPAGARNHSSLWGEKLRLTKTLLAAHPCTGPIQVSKGGCDTNIGRKFLEIAAQYDKDREASPSADLNDFQTINVYAPWHKYIDSQTGKPSDTAHHFLYNLANFSLDPSESKHNVHVSTNRRVVRVIFENNRAIGVEYVAREDTNSEHRLQPRIAYASRLIVLSSGAFGSPAILERSGIGSAKRLAEVDIRSRQFVDLPGVGENYNASEESDCLDAIFSGDEEAIKHAGVKLRPTPEELEELGPAFKPVWDEFYVGAPDKPVALLGCKTFGMIFVTAYPKATGSTHITSTVNPWAPLRFDPQFLEDPADITVLRWVYKRGREIARRMKSFRGEISDRHPKFSSESSAWNNNTGPVAIDAPKIQYSKEDDRAIDDYIKATVGTTWHSLGKCAMKPRAAGGVVDPRLNVYGVENLKVADISIAPLNVGANTNSTALVIGENAFLLITDDLGISLKCTQATGEFKGPDV